MMWMMVSGASEWTDAGGGDSESALLGVRVGGTASELWSVDGIILGTILEWFEAGDCGKGCGTRQATTSIHSWYPMRARTYATGVMADRGGRRRQTMKGTRGISYNVIQRVKHHHARGRSSRTEKTRSRALQTNETEIKPDTK